MMALAFLWGVLFPALWTINLGVVMPLSISCLVILVVIPSAARRGRFSVPVYALLMFTSAIVAYGTGLLAGARSVRGTTLGIVISFIFFLLVAAAAGCFFGICFYRQPSDDSLPSRQE